jgi:dTDP-4-amino-4,6-dideoxygalactose transaminase
MRDALHLAGIETGIHYPAPVHLQKAYAGLGYGAGYLRVSETAADEFLSLPIYAEMPPDHVAAVTEELTRARLADPETPPCDRPVVRSTALHF